MIKKSKEHDESFIKIIAKGLVQPLLDNLINGGNIDSISKDKKGSKRPEM